MLRAISDYYRIPDGAITFSENTGPKAEAGFFEFDGVTCFGRSRVPVASTNAGPLLDGKATARTVGNTLSLDFDPDELAENLRHERYRSVAGQRGDTVKLSTGKRTDVFVPVGAGICIRCSIPNCRCTIPRRLGCVRVFRDGAGRYECGGHVQRR